MAVPETPGKMYALAAVLSVLAVVAVILRFYSRRLLKTARIEMDDYLILMALLFTLGTGLCMFIGAALGDLGRHTKIDADGMPEFSHRTQIFQQTSYASLLTQTLTFGFTKLAVLFFYKRIFTNGRVIYVIWTLIGLVNIWTIAFFFTNLLQCFPISVNWTGWGAAIDSCINTNTMFLAQAWSDVVTDVLILSLPLPCIWRLQMPTPQKIAVSSIFLLGTLVVAAGVTKLVVYYEIVAETQSGNDDVTYILTPTLYWPMIEASLGIVGACLPSMRPILRDFSLKSIVHNVRCFMAVAKSHSRKFAGTSEKVDDACSQSSTKGLCHKRDEEIEAKCDLTAAEATANDSLLVNHVDRFDDLPDFPSLADNRRKGACADNMV